MYCYTAYGLTIRSDLRLPELLVAGGATADVAFREGRVDRPPEVVGVKNGFHAEGADAYFFWETVGSFRVRNGQEIVVEPTPGVDERDIRLPLLGTVLAVLLHQRGLLVLHASAVAFGGRATAFLGAKGQGKSTMAAALYGRGSTLLADDVLAIDLPHNAEPVVLPGFPRLKLLPEAAAHALGDDPELLPRVASDEEKRIRRVVDRFADRSVPLESVCTLAEGPEPALKPLDRQSAITSLIGHSFAARFGDRLLHGAAALAHLRKCASLLGYVTPYTLERPRSLSMLPEVAQLVEERLGVAASYV
jgi:hypothetical protein